MNYIFPGYHMAFIASCGPLFGPLPSQQPRRSGGVRERAQHRTGKTLADEVICTVRKRTVTLSEGILFGSPTWSDSLTLCDEFTKSDFACFVLFRRVHSNCTNIIEIFLLWNVHLGAHPRVPPVAAGGGTSKGMRRRQQRCT